MQGFESDGCNPLAINPYPPGGFNSQTSLGFPCRQSSDIENGIPCRGLPIDNVRRSRQWIPTWLGPHPKRCVTLGKYVSPYCCVNRLTLRQRYKLRRKTKIWQSFFLQAGVSHLIAINLVDHPEIVLAAFAAMLPISAVQHGDYYYRKEPHFAPPAQYQEGACSHLICWSAAAASYVRTLSRDVPIDTLGGPLWALKYQNHQPPQDRNAVVIYESQKSDTSKVVDALAPVVSAQGLILYRRPHPFHTQSPSGSEEQSTFEAVPVWEYALHERAPAVAVSVGSTISSECAFLRVPVLTVLPRGARRHPSCPPAGVHALNEPNVCADHLQQILTQDGEKQKLLDAQSHHLHEWLSGEITPALSSVLAAKCVEHARQFIHMV